MTVTVPAATGAAGPLAPSQRGLFGGALAFEQGRTDVHQILLRRP